jgi:hypothetical protein
MRMLALGILGLVAATAEAKPPTQNCTAEDMAVLQVRNLWKDGSFDGTKDDFDRWTKLFKDRAEACRRGEIVAMPRPRPPVKAAPWKRDGGVSDGDAYEEVPCPKGTPAWRKCERKKTSAQ